MDDNTVGGIVGSILGVMGGIAGTYFSIKNTNGPKERAFTIRCSALCWLAVSVFLAFLLLLPRSWGALIWLVWIPFLYSFIRWGNERQAHAKIEDTADRELPAGHAVGS